MKNRYNTIIFFLFLCQFSFGQLEADYSSQGNTSLPEWIQLMYAKDADPGKVKSLYDQYYLVHTFVKNEHTQYFKRWLKSYSRIYPTDKKSLENYNRRRTASKNKLIRTNNWVSLGPYDWDHDAAGRSYAAGAAHVYTIEQSISNPNTLYAGTATSGIWKSVNHGDNWDLVTSNLLVNSCTAISIDYTDDQIVYAEILSSVYKSIDGGANWSATGNSTFQNISMNVKDIIMHPSNQDILFLASSTGIYRSIDAGTNWTTILSGDFLEIELHPTDPNYVYTVQRSGDVTIFYRSDDNGISYTVLDNGWPSPDLSNGEFNRRTEIAVSAAAPDDVYAHVTGSANGGSGLYGVYISRDKGENWTFQCCGPQPAGVPSTSNMNLMAWSDEGTDDGGQYNYNVAFEVNPTDADHVLLAGTNLWVSQDKGSTFTCPAKWSHSYKPNYVHADIHDIKYFDHTNEIWIACDGGIFFSDDNGANYTRKILGISGTDFWGYGQGFWFGDVMLGGAYHNGTMLREEGTYINDWICTDGGDGIRGFVNPGLDRQVYSDYNIKKLKGDRTVEPDSRIFLNKPNASYIVGESSDMLFHPAYYGWWYTGVGTKIVRTKDNGISYDDLYDFGERVVSSSISWSNPNVIYVCTWPDWWGKKKIFRTNDAGINWTEITPEVPDLDWIPYDIEVDPLDENKIWVARTSQYGTPAVDGKSLFFSDDGGSSWSNISSTGLEGESPSSMALQKGSDGGIYIGTRRAVYYKDNTMSSWELYSNNLPASTFSTRLEPYYRKSKIRNATNRSVYESDLHTPNTTVIAQASVQWDTLICIQDTAYFVDHSIVTDDNVNWSWSFPGGTPNSSTDRNPKIIYECPGNYGVSLTVSDTHGSDTQEIETIIHVARDCATADENNSLLCEADDGHGVIPNLDITTTQFTLTAWIKPNGIQNNYAAIMMNDGSDGGGLNFREGNNTLGYHWPNGQWYWDSNLEVIPGEWSYVAMVVENDGITIYLNDEKSKHFFSPGSVEFTNIRLGSYKTWTSRNYNGEIDEVCMWNRSLTDNEIKSYRHIQQNDVGTDMIIAYYKLNRSDGIIEDAHGEKDGMISGTSSKIISSSPVSSGVSDLVSINAAGTYNFPNTGVELVFPSGRTYPNGDVVISRLDGLPKNSAFVQTPLWTGYYIVNNYGTNTTISPLESITFSNENIVNSYTAATDNFVSLHRRMENSDLSDWSLWIGNNPDVTAGNPGQVQYTDANSMINLDAQMINLRADFPEGKPQVFFASDSAHDGLLKGGQSMALGLISENQGLILPILDETGLENIGNAAAGLLAYYEENNCLLFSDGDQWLEIKGTEVTVAIDPSATAPTTGLSIGDNNNISSGLIRLPPSSGMILLPSLLEEELPMIETPVEGMMLYNTTEKSIQYYNGIEWKKLKSLVSLATYNIGSNQITPNEGVSVLHNNRNKNAIIDIASMSRYTLGLAPLDVRMIAQPVKGLLVYDTSYKAFIYYDGNFWKKI